MTIPPLYFSKWLSQWQRFPWLPEMSGRHVAMLEGGDAGNSFLQTTQIDETPNTVHTLTVAVGVRDTPATFGGVRLDILANGRVVATASYTKQGLDGIRGSDAKGRFTDVSLAYVTGPNVVANRPLAIRISKIGGAGTVLDFDNVRFTTAGSDYFDRSSRLDGGVDPDLDPSGLSNGVEYFLELEPRDAGGTAAEGASGHVARYIVPLDPVATDPGFELQYSFDLRSWLPVASSVDGKVTRRRNGTSLTVEITLGRYSRAFLRKVAPK